MFTSKEMEREINSHTVSWKTMSGWKSKVKWENENDKLQRKFKSSQETLSDWMENRTISSLKTAGFCCPNLVFNIAKS